MIHLYDKLPNTGSRFVDVPVVVEVNFFLFEGADESFSIPILPTMSSILALNSGVNLLRFRFAKCSIILV